MGSPRVARASRLPRALVLAAAFGALAVACGGGAAKPVKGTYTLRLFDYSPGAQLRLKLREAESSVVLGRYDGSVDPQGNRTITLPDVLEDGKTYWVDYFLDLDRDGQYAPPTATGYPEPSWRRIFPGDSAGFTDSAVRDERYVNIAPY